MRLVYLYEKLIEKIFSNSNENTFMTMFKSITHKVEKV